MKKVVVYKGLSNGEIVHIGITTQKPEVRFRTHEKRNLIDEFVIVAEFEEANEASTLNKAVDKALELEKELILKYKPKYSKRIKQNDNRKLSNETVEGRKNNSEWCQSCLRRRVNKGYKRCKWCS